ncbi:MAG: ABC transporter ATP-binding protein [Acidimicrobiales bacterium]
MTTVLQAVGVSKRYGETVALDGVDLAICCGQIVALLGPNGAGKSTLSNIICGLLQADSGKVTIGESSLMERPEVTRQLVGYAPQEIALYPSRSVKANLTHFARLTGLRGKSLAAEIERVEGALLLNEFMDKRVSNLSGGQRRRAHAAVGLIGHRQLLVLDEPTAGADIQTRRAILETVRNAAQDGAAVCYCTHYLPEVEDLNADLTVINKGRVVVSGSLEELRGRSQGGAVISVRSTGTLPTFDSEFSMSVNSRDGYYELEISCAEPLAAARSVMQTFASSPTSTLEALEIRRQSLEESFLSLIDEEDAEP